MLRPWLAGTSSTEAGEARIFDAFITVAPFKTMTRTLQATPAIAVASALLLRGVIRPAMVSFRPHNDVKA